MLENMNGVQVVKNINVVDDTSEKELMQQNMSKKAIFVQSGGENGVQETGNGVYASISTADVQMCVIDNTAFSGRNNLTAPLHINTKEKLAKEKFFVCEICSMAFTQKCQLSAHLLIHTKEKPHVCEMCGKEFSRKHHLSRHFLVHSNMKAFECNVCEKTFSYRSGLIRHLRIHSKEKPYACEICSKSFTRKSGLKIHYRIHTNERPHICETCGKAFTEKSGLKKHLLVHTKKNNHVCNIFVVMDD